MVGRLLCKTVSVVQYTITRKGIYKTLDVISISLSCIAQLLMTTLRKKKIFLYNCFMLFVHANKHLLAADHRSGSVQDDGKLY